MGYTTDFDGSIAIEPPLNEAEITYLRRFADTRRMLRAKGPYYTGTGVAGQDNEADITAYNSPPDGQPGLWCKWISNSDGTALVWDGREKFYDAAEWMSYLLDTFLRPGAALQMELADRVPGRVYPPAFDAFTFDHHLSGRIEAQGEDPDDRWGLVVNGDEVTVEKYAVVKADAPHDCPSCQCEGGGR